MKKNVFNCYVDYVCRELGVTRDQLFRKNRSAKFSTARFLLYALCYQRPMTVVQIVDLMAENGYEIARAGVQYGIEKIQEANDVDANDFISRGLEECSLVNQFNHKTNKEINTGISIYPNSNQKKEEKKVSVLSDALKLLRQDYMDGVFNKEEYKEERLRLIRNIGK